MAKLGFKFEGQFDGIVDRVLAALSEGRFTLETETFELPSDGDFVLLGVRARRLVVDLTEPDPLDAPIIDVPASR